MKPGSLSRVIWPRFDSRPGKTMRYCIADIVIANLTYLLEGIGPYIVCIPVKNNFPKGYSNRNHMNQSSEQGFGLAFLNSDFCRFFESFPPRMAEELERRDQDI